MLKLIRLSVSVLAATAATAATTASTASASTVPPPCPPHQPVWYSNGDLVIQYGCMAPITIPIGQPPPM